MGTLTRSDSGLIYDTAFPGVALPAGMASAIAVNGTVAVAGGELTVTDPDNASKAVAYYVAALPAFPFVLRARYKTTGGNFSLNALYVRDHTVNPWPTFGAAGTAKQNHYFLHSTPACQRLCAGGYDGQQVYAINTFYVTEIVYDAIGDVDVRLRDDALAQVWLKSGAEIYVDDLFVAVAVNHSAGATGTSVSTYFQIIESLNILVTGLGAGNAVRIYDAGDVVKQSAVEVGGTATLDCSAIGHFPFTGYLKVWEDNTYAVELARYPAAGNSTDIYGGDDYVYVAGPVITSITPTSQRVMQSITIAGMGFGAVQGASTVTVNGVAVTDVTSWADLEIVCLVPVGATTGDVIVTVGAIPSLGFAFTVLPPIIATLIPEKGRVGARVAMMSKHLGATRATFGYAVEFHDGVAVVDYISWDDNEIVVLVPPGAATGEVEVVV